MRNNVALTEETVGSDGGSKLVRCLLIALALVVAVNFGSRMLLDRYSANRGYWLIRSKWELLLDKSRPGDWLILGDSSCNQGVRPDIFDEVVGGHSLNYCTIANLLAMHDSWMLDAYVARHGAPKGVVLVHVYDMWWRPFEKRIGATLCAKIPLPWGFWRELDPPMPLDAGDQWVVFETRYLPLYSENDQLGRWLRDLRTVRKPPFYLDPAGYMPVHEPNPKGVHDDTNGHHAFVRRFKFTVSDVNRQALDHMVEVADKLGFELYFADSPMHDALARDRMFMAYHAGIEQMLDAYAAKSPHVHYALRQPVTFPIGVMENSDHLTHGAAETYTRALADAVKAARDGAALK